VCVVKCEMCSDSPFRGPSSRDTCGGSGGNTLRNTVSTTARSRVRKKKLQECAGTARISVFLRFNFKTILP
jgi:hypothetical protein